MIIALSPSKSMNMEPVESAAFTQPEYLSRSAILVNKLRTLSRDDLMEFMEISKKLADLNQGRIRNWHPPFDRTNAKQAILAFTGDVYEGLDAGKLDPDDLTFAQDHLRILSGLYGLLRPLDLIQPYRLEMGRPLQTKEADNLYAFWRTRITSSLNNLSGNILINLASQEYFKAIDRRKLNKEVVSPAFKEEKNGRYKIISFYAKKARGTMARYLIQNRISKPEDLLHFSGDGYAYNESLSNPGEPVFTRSTS